MPDDQDQMPSEKVSTGKHAAPVEEPEDTESETVGIPVPPDAAETDVTDVLAALPPEPPEVDDREPEAKEPEAEEPEAVGAAAKPEPQAVAVPEAVGPEDLTDIAEPKARDATDIREPAEPADADEIEPAKAAPASQTQTADVTEVFEAQAADVTDVFEAQPAETTDVFEAVAAHDMGGFEKPSPADTDVFEKVAATEAPARGAEEAPPDAEIDRERLQRLLQFVARQEPGLRWAVGVREDGATLVVTDLAYGWIPSGITLPAGVRLLEPRRRTGNAAALLGNTTVSATYSPGDSLGWATDFALTESSLQPREVPEVEDLGWLLSEATHWRDGLPRMVHTLAKAGAAGTGVVEAELDVLRVHLDTARYQLLAQYPDVELALLLNCLLLAATEGIATGDRLSANYHFAWFQALSAPPASRFSGTA
ncbi:DUF5631 domain-containing protein [Mycobacterium noviomagense]|uniref:DUF5631 domain-containing protein n=1 Tax=Mycobacterium noviomagense TaxID=459858 RepID=UPI001E457797|nr:DUF5631 domain-containing protein [Mycobacterium noviomagense]